MIKHLKNDLLIIVVKSITSIYYELNFQKLRNVERKSRYPPSFDISNSIAEKSAKIFEPLI